MTTRPPRERTVYLLHFSEPLAHARHYIGVTRGDVERRFEEHMNHEGARITRAARAAGITFILARVWHNVPFAYERKLKNQGGATRCCPICNPGLRPRGPNDHPRPNPRLRPGLS